MFQRRLSIDVVDEAGTSVPAQLRWLDTFAMRNFTNDAVFDDTLPIADGVLEAGLRVPLDRLEAAMTDWFCRKSYLAKSERLRITEPLDAMQAAN